MKNVKKIIFSFFCLMLPIQTAYAIIYFYEKGQTYEEFSNLHNCGDIGISVNIPSIGIVTTRTSEALYQACKQLGNPIQFTAVISDIDTAAGKGCGMQAAIKRTNAMPINPQFFKLNLYIMYEVVKAKFEQSPSLLAILMATGNQEIIEHAPKDAIWGDNYTESHNPGKNWLGKVLMKVRQDNNGGKEYPKLDPNQNIIGDMNQFEADLKKHKETWLAHFKVPITGRPTSLSMDNEVAYSFKKKEVSRDNTPVFFDGTKHVAWAPNAINPKTKKVCPCFKIWDTATSCWGHYDDKANQYPPYTVTTFRTQDDTPVFEDQERQSFAWDPRKSYFRFWNTAKNRWGLKYNNAMNI